MLFFSPSSLPHMCSLGNNSSQCPRWEKSYLAQCPPPPALHTPWSTGQPPNPAFEKHSHPPPQASSRRSPPG
ncbi:hypothetical protein F751_6261 [Auxenochlorella protothecoides]|uniref:Uncharacterized protein n=1 Tax=Auxenochlorella protothecoides TaxID=3075 RepID=A0A087SK56_AUXPR|nr:hypothetical protein F751_6261 [Auxenochlorella protothecoides]KFM26110.1 hypothetical protein F751_6261 [Auxenochlorella protothecoides]